MAIDISAIEQRYSSDIEAAKAWEDADPARYNEQLREAERRRSEGYKQIAEESTASAKKATLEQARSAALAQFPLADPDSVSGDSAQAIQAAAERSHKFVEGKQQEAQRAALEARRPATRAAWTGSPTGARPGIPGGETVVPESREQKLADATYDRTAEILREARNPGTLRRYGDEAMKVLRSQDVEAQAFADYRLLHPNSGLSDQAMRARAEGTVQLVPTPSGVPEGEDRKG